MADDHATLEMRFHRVVPDLVGNRRRARHELKGGAQAEPLFDVSKISDLQLLDEYFEESGPNYACGDSAMREIFEQL